MKAVGIRRAGPPETLEAIDAVAASGKAKPVIAAGIPLDKAWEAHRLLQGRTTIGKVLLAVRN